MNIASQDIQKVLAVKKLYNTQTYNADYLTMLLDTWRGKLSDIEASRGTENPSYAILNSRYTELQKVLEGQGVTTGASKGYQATERLLTEPLQLNR